MDINDQLTEESEQGNLAKVKYLIEQGADVHAYDYEALRLASHFGYIKVVKYLVSQGADIHEIEDFSLRYASELGHRDIVKYLETCELNFTIIKKRYHGYR
jgi:ankyrin repeat protein